MVDKGKIRAQCTYCLFQFDVNKMRFWSTKLANLLILDRISSKTSMHLLLCQIKSFKVNKQVLSIGMRILIFS